MSKMKKLLILISMVVVSISWTFVNGMWEIVKNTEKTTINSYKKLNSSEQKVFSDIKKKLIKALYNTDDMELLKVLHSKVKAAKEKRSFWELDYTILSFAMEWIELRIKQLWRNIQIQDKLENSFYKEKYGERIKKFDDLILSFQKNLAKDGQQISKIFKNNSNNIFNNDSLNRKDKENRELSLDLDVKWDNYLKLNSILSVISKFDMQNSFLDSNIKFNADVESNYLENNISIKNDFDIIQNKKDLFVKFNELNYSWIEDFLDKNEKIFYNIIYNLLNKNKWKYIKIEDNWNIDNINSFIKEYTELEKEIYEKENKIFEYMNNNPLFAVYGKLWKNKYKLMYTQEFINFMYLITEDKYENKSLKEDFKKNLENDYLILEDMGNWKYSLYGLENYDNQDFKIIISKNWIEYIKFTDEKNTFEYKNNKLFLNNNEFNISIDLSKLHSLNSNINISWNIKEQGVSLNFDIKITENNWISFEWSANYSWIEALLKGEISKDKANISVNIDNITKSINSMIAFLYWKRLWLKSLNLDIKYKYNHENIQDINIKIPDNYLLQNDLFLKVFWKTNNENLDLGNVKKNNENKNDYSNITEQIAIDYDRENNINRVYGTEKAEVLKWKNIQKNVIWWIMWEDEIYGWDEDDIIILIWDMTPYGKKNSNKTKRILWKDIKYFNWKDFTVNGMPKKIDGWLWYNTLFIMWNTDLRWIKIENITKMDIY